MGQHLRFEHLMMRNDAQNRILALSYTRNHKSDPLYKAAKNPLVKQMIAARDINEREYAEALRFVHNGQREEEKLKRKTSES